jgi:hypothetical protein
MATGDNTHGQGVRFAGRGFDEQTTLQASQWVPWFSNTTWPPKSGTYDSIGGAKQIRVNAKCEQDPSPDLLFALCYGEVHVDGSVEETPACDPKVASKGPVPLLAIRGKWNTGSGAFLRNDEVLTFACAPTFTKKNPRFLSEVKPIVGLPSDPPSDLDDSPNLGVLAKCYFWGFAQRKGHDRGDERRFLTYQACLRAARAEYCGGGRSQTEEGTIIQVYEPGKTTVGQPIKVTLDPPECTTAKDPKSDKNYKDRKPLRFKPCFEALWDHERAVCVSHARFEEMPARACQNDFEHAFSAFVKGKEVRVFPVRSSSDPVFLHCKVNDYDAAVGQARVKNGSGINTLDGGVRGCHNDIPCP